jgi:hypothetical protein
MDLFDSSSKIEMRSLKLPRVDLKIQASAYSFAQKPQKNIKKNLYSYQPRDKYIKLCSILLIHSP